MSAACYYNIPSDKNRVYCRRLPWICLSSLSSGTKRHKNHPDGALLVPSLSPCLCSRGGSCRGGKPAKPGRKSRLFLLPKAALRTGHNSVLGQVCRLVCAGGDLSRRSGDTKKFRHNFTATALCLVKTIPETPKKPPKPTQTQNLGD